MLLVEIIKCEMCIKEEKKNQKMSYNDNDNNESYKLNPCIYPTDPPIPLPTHENIIQVSQTLSSLEKNTKSRLENLQTEIPF